MSTKKEKINRELAKTRKELEAAQSELDMMAAECIRLGRTFADDAALLRQNEIVDELIVTELNLQSMLDEEV